MRKRVSEIVGRAAAKTSLHSVRFVLKLLKIVLAGLPVWAVLMLAAAGSIVLAVFGSISGGTDGGRAEYSGNMTVTPVAAEIWEYFTEEGYTKVQTAAILGNLRWESGLDPASSMTTESGTTVRGIAQWTSYRGAENKLEQYAQSVGGDWDDLWVQCECIDMTLQGTNPYCGWYNTGMGNYYGVTKQDFWEGDLYQATMSFFCCFEDPEEYPDGCNNYGYVTSSACLSISFDCGNGHGRYPYAQFYYDILGGNGRIEDDNETAVDVSYEGMLPQSGMEIPHYKQGSYAGVSWGATNLAASGCGPVSLSMVISYLTGKTVTPVDVIGWCGNSYLAKVGNGYGSSWELFPAAAKNWGLSYGRTEQKGYVDEALRSGYPVIAREAPGSFFSRVGHFIVLRGITSDGMYLVNDPAAKYPLEREFSWDEIHRSGNFYMIFAE